MFRRFYYRLRYEPYLHSEHGIKELAEAWMGRFSYEMSKEAAYARERNQNLILEKVDLLRRAGELSRETTLEPGEYAGVRKRVWGGALLVMAAFLAAAFLGCAATAAFMPEGAESAGAFLVTASVLLAFLLTGSGLFACERLLDAFSSGAPGGPRREPSDERRMLPWMLLLICVELATLGFATVPAGLLAEAAASAPLYHAVMIISSMLPLIAGCAYRDVLTRIDAYRNTQAQHRIEVRLAQIEAMLHQNGSDQQSFFERELLACWNRLNTFKAYKGYYNVRHGLSEHVDFHFAESFEAFQAEAQRRCQAYRKDAEALSPEHLAAQLSRVVAGPNERPARSAEGDGQPDVSWSEIRLGQ